METHSLRRVLERDGDAIVVAIPQKEHVRLLGIDAPEKSPGDHADAQCALLGVDADCPRILAKLSAFTAIYEQKLGSELEKAVSEQERKGPRAG